MLKYKGYVGAVELDPEAKILHGRVIGIKDVITFEGETVDEVMEAFHDSIDDYLEFCQELGQEPEKPFSGHLPYRTNPETHRAIYFAATKAGKSINAWIDEVLREAASASS